MKPLQGFRILDFTQFMSGPMCTLLLSDFGAEVIKIENPPLGDATRQGKILEEGVSSHYATRNRGKKSIVLNMKNEEHKALFLELAKTADAVVENFKPGTMEKFGITYELLKEINPRIVFTSISGFGQSGPAASIPAFDATVQAESGLMSISGEENGRPQKCGAAIADYCGGLVGCIGTLMGIISAQKTGIGRRVDVAMMDSLVFLLENQFSVYLKTGAIPARSGNRYPGSSPIGDFMCKDGVPLMLNISTDRQWKIFAEALQQPQWLTDPDFADMNLRGENYQKVEAEVSRVFAEWNSEELFALLREHNCVCGRINDFEALKNHPQIEARKMIVSAEYDNGVRFSVPGNPIQMSGMERENVYTAARLGQDTFSVLREVADDEKLHRLFDGMIPSADD